MRRWGTILLVIGVLMALVSLARPYPFRVGVGGHEASVWVVLAIFSLLLVSSLGLVCALAVVVHDKGIYR